MNKNIDSQLDVYIFVMFLGNTIKYQSAPVIALSDIPILTFRTQCREDFTWWGEEVRLFS